MMWPFKKSLADRLSASLLAEADRWREDENTWTRDDGVMVSVRCGYASAYGSVQLGVDTYAMSDGEAWRFLMAVTKIRARQNRAKGAAISALLAKQNGE